MNARCHAAVAANFGGVEQLQLREMPLPRPGRGQVLVQVSASAVNPIDIRRRQGYGRRLMSVMGAARLPLVLGNDFAGTVCAVGSGVTTLREGDAVFGAKPPSSQGSHATHVAVDAKLAVRQPRAMAAEQLAVLPYNFLTVLRAFAGAGITGGAVAGRDVLVYGASGGLGLIALRLLANMGARVTAVAGGASGDACKQAGAHIVVDRHATPLRALPRNYAATLNFASWEDEAALHNLLMPEALGHATTVHPLLGTLDRHGLAGGLARVWLEKRSMAARLPHGAKYAWSVFRPDRTALEHLAEIAPRLELPTVIVRYPLSRAAQAHRHVEQRQPGRAILLPHLS